MQFAGFAILVVANCYLGGEKSARNVILRNATVVGCTGNKQMKTLFDIPLAHTKDPVTSYEAAEKMVKSGKLSYQENQVWQWINSYLYANQKDDFTAKELVWWRYSNKYHVIERRLSGLRNKGKIERTGETREGCKVWRLLDGNH